MTDCISPLDFGFLSGKAIVGGFDGGDISSDGGLLLLAEVDKALMRKFDQTQTRPGEIPSMNIKTNWGV